MFTYINTGLVYKTKFLEYMILISALLILYD